MNELITGYNALHLKNFSAEELNALAQVLPKGLTYRLYGGGNVTDFVLNSLITHFLIQVEGSIVITQTETNVERVELAIEVAQDQGIPIKAVQWRNELYLFDEPVWWQNFGAWWMYTFRKSKYYRQLADKHMADWWNMVDYDELYNGLPTTINLPLKVNQNAGFKAYASQWLKYMGFTSVSLHVYGVPVDVLRKNLEWYRANTNRKIHIYEFNGLKNQRDQPYRKNGYNHKYYHNLQLETIHDVLGDQLGDIIYFTLAGNDTTASWEDPAFLHKYQVQERTIPGVVEYEHDGRKAFLQVATGEYEVINTIENVMP